MNNNGEVYDVIVIGAGLVGGWAAMVLAERGARVLLLDAGPILPPEAFAGIPRDGVAYRVGRLVAGQGQLWKAGYVNGATHRFYVNDRAHPYTFPRNRPFMWIRGRQVGGRGHTWGRMALRFSPADLQNPLGCEAEARWPITYEEIAPFYSDVERALELEGEPAGLEALPDGAYVRPHPLTDAEDRFRTIVEARLPQLQVVPARVLGYAAGAIPPAIAAAVATGRVTLRPKTVVARISTDASGRAASGVLAVDCSTGKSFSARSGLVFCCASTIESIRLLLNSSSDVHPRGLGNASGLLGCYLMDHISTWRAGTIEDSNPKVDTSWFNAASKQGLYIPALCRRQEPGRAFVGTYGVQLSIGRGKGWEMGAFGEMLPRKENRVLLNSRTRDPYGIPTAHVECSFSGNELALSEDADRLLHDLAEVSGFEQNEKLPVSWPMRAGARLLGLLAAVTGPVPGSAIHECGGARMGSSPEKSVLDPHNRLWDVPNVFVCDAACFPLMSFQNPTLTCMALAARAAHFSTQAGTAG
jgi:choline dehydrogenase-like flavoprotein